MLIPWLQHPSVSLSLSLSLRGVCVCVCVCVCVLSAQEEMKAFGLIKDRSKIGFFKLIYFTHFFRV